MSGMGDWSAAGGSTDVYIGQRLLYRTQLDEGDQGFGAVSGQGFRSAVFSIVMMGTLLAVPIFWLSNMVLHLDALSGLLILAGYVLVGLIPERQWVSQWELTLDGRSAAAGAAYGTIAKSLRDRKIPVAVEPRRIKSSVGGEVRNYLVIRRGRYAVYVGVFPYGTGLFLTWSMWLDMSRLRIIGQYLAQVVANLMGRGSHFHDVIRSDPDRALREAVHNATREGVEAAVLGTELSVESILGDVAIEAEEAIAGTPLGGVDARGTVARLAASSGPAPIPARPVGAPPATMPATPPGVARVPAPAPVITPAAPTVVTPVTAPGDTPPVDTPIRTAAAPSSFCIKCGAALQPGTTFCVSCGARL